MIKNKQGLSVIEFVIVLGVIAILSTIAWPFFNNYLHRYNYKPILQAVEPYKTAVNDCYEKFEKLSKCSGGVNHIPGNITKTTGSIDYLIVANGVIMVVPTKNHGILRADTYMLRPTIQNNTLSWKASGLSVDKGYAD